MSSRTPLGQIAVWGGLAGLYFLVGRLGLRLASVHPSATPVWAASGVALAALVLAGRSAWPGVFAGAFLVNITTTGSILTCLGIAAGNTMEAVTGAWLVDRLAQGRQAFESPQDSFKFAGLAGGLSTMTAATVGVLSLCATGYAAWSGAGTIWLTWWLGDAMGDWLVAPFIILWMLDWKLRWGKAQTLELTALFATLVLVSSVVFGRLLPGAAPHYAIDILCIPILLWAAFRFGAREASTATLVLAAIAMWGTWRGFGPFAQGPVNTSLLLLQIYLGIATVMSIAVAASVWLRKRLELQLLERERQLSRHAADMEQFAYAANHDLGEPLRTITLFAQLLAQRRREQLGSDGQEYVERIITCVARMETLMKGLLDYSRQVHLQEFPAATVSMDDVLDSVQKNLEQLIRQHQARILCGKLPTVEGNREQLVSLCQNLVANAIKYRGTEPPVVEIAAERNEREWTFSVHDNGIGIDASYHERVFAMFKRLRPQEDGGSGLGLAIARRIVEHHGGRIWVESKPGHGATFLFTIPQAKRIKARAAAAELPSSAPEGGRARA